MDKVFIMSLRKNDRIHCSLYTMIPIENVFIPIHLFDIYAASTMGQVPFGMLRFQQLKRTPTPTPVGPAGHLPVQGEPAACWSWLKPVHKNKLWNQAFASRLLNTAVLASGRGGIFTPLAHTAHQGRHSTPSCPVEPVAKHLPEQHWGGQTVQNINKHKIYMVSCSRAY